MCCIQDIKLSCKDRYMPPLVVFPLLPLYLLLLLHKQIRFLFLTHQYMRGVQKIRGCGFQKSLSERGKAAVVWWFGHIERMGGGRLMKKIYREEMEGNRGRGRVRRRWVDGVKGCFSDRGLIIPEAKECVKDRRVEMYCWGAT